MTQNESLDLQQGCNARSRQQLICSKYLGFISKKLEGHWIRELEGQGIEGKGSLIKLEIHSHVLHCDKTVEAAKGCH